MGNSKTLVIHPSDESTEMLAYVYENKGFDVISNPNISISDLKKAIREHDRIIMLGHGTPMGMVHPELIKYGMLVTPNARFYILDDSFADLLRTKETISMWCYSDEYFMRNRIPGFHTGMIISEVTEAKLMLGYSPLSEAELYHNMVYLSKVMHDCIDESPEEMRRYILEHYNADDEITQFNRENINVLK